MINPSFWVPTATGDYGYVKVTSVHNIFWHFFNGYKVQWKTHTFVLTVVALTSIALILDDNIPTLAWLAMIGIIPPIISIKAVGDSVELEFHETMKNLNVLNQV